MPKRTNDFQKLILEINKHFASSTAEVFESKMLFDPRSKQDREIDIYIEDSIAGYKLKLGIECTALKSKVGVQELDIIAAKHRAVGINKTIVVSKFGFTETAQTQALSEGIELITYEAATDRNWPSYVNNLMQLGLEHFSCQIKTIELEWAADQDIHPFKLTESSLVIENEELVSPLPDFLLLLLSNVTEGSMIPSEVTCDQGAAIIEFKQYWGFYRPLILRDEQGIERACVKLGGTFVVTRNKISPLMRWGNYGNRFAASGTQEDIGPFASATITSSTTGELTEDGRQKYSLKISLNTKNNAE